MGKRKKELTWEDLVEKSFYFLKEKLKFDDVQAIVWIGYTKLDRIRIDMLN